MKFSSIVVSQGQQNRKVCYNTTVLRRSNSSAVLSIVLAVLMMSCVRGDYSCVRNPEAERTLLHMCFFEEGFSNMDGATFATLQLSELCGVRSQFIKAIKCQMKYLEKCSPAKTVEAMPGVDQNGLPKYIDSVCDTAGFNSTCFDDHKLDLNTCSRSGYWPLPQPGIQTKPEASQLCDAMLQHGVACAKKRLSVCGAVTVDTVANNLKHTMPTKCLAILP